MSEPDTARLRAIVDRIAVAVGVDPNEATVSVEHARQGRRWLASVTWSWPGAVAHFRFGVCRRGTHAGYGPDDVWRVRARVEGAL